jgi:hypothetical protein
MARTCVITPKLRPAVCGIGDYCLCLLHHCTVDPATPTRWQFLVLEGASQSARDNPSLDVQLLTKSSDRLVELLNQSGCDTVFLQYTVYIYGNDSRWLADGLLRWKREAAGRRVVIMFHEIWDTTLNWMRKLLGVLTAQKNSVRRLLQIADVAVTSIDVYVKYLQSLVPGKPVRVLPGSSSFAAIPEQQVDWRQMLIFGQGGPRLRAVAEHEQLIKRLCAERLLERIVIAGQCSVPKDDALLLLERWKLPVQLESAYNVAGDALPSSMTVCGLSLMNVSSTYLLKSSSFHVACMLGQVSIVKEAGNPGLPLVAGENYVAYDDAHLDRVIATMADRTKLAAIGAQARELANGQLSWNAVAKHWHQILEEPSS